MKIDRMTNHVIKTAILSLAILIAFVAQGGAQFKPGDGLYIVVNSVPQQCKAKIDGFYRVSKEGKISFSFSNIQIAVDWDTKSFNEKIENAIQHYCRQEFPDRNLSPDIFLISEAEAKRAGDGVWIFGAVGKACFIPMTEGLTVFQAVEAAGGTNEFSKISQVTILQKEKVIECDFTKVESLKTVLESGALVYVPLKRILTPID